MHKTIFNMVTYGKGGWDWNTLYHLPVFLRRFYVEMMAKALDEEREAAERAQNQVSTSKISAPPTVR